MRGSQLLFYLLYKPKPLHPWNSFSPFLFLLLVTPLEHFKSTEKKQYLLEPLTNTTLEFPQSEIFDLLINFIYKQKEGGLKIYDGKTINLHFPDLQ